MNSEGKISSSNSSGRAGSGGKRQHPPPHQQQRPLLLPPPPHQQRLLLLPPPAPAPADAEAVNEEVASNNVVDEASRRGEKGDEEQTSMKKKKKRGRPATASGEAGVGGSGTKPKFDAPEVATPCSVCGKQFRSWKALFGHMRSHPERTWRGVNPPPTFSSQPSPNAAGATQMLTLNAQVYNNRMQVEAVDPPARRMRRRVLEFDLNHLPENQNGHSGSSGGSAKVHGFDLNALPENSGAEE